MISSWMDAGIRMSRMTRLVKENGTGIFGMAARYASYNVSVKRSREETTERNILGFRMRLFTKDSGISKTLIVKGFHEKLAGEVYRKYLKSGMVILDIGANIGYYVLQEAKAVGPGGKVYAIEPVPRNVEMLNGNIELNDFKNVETFRLAVSDKKGTSKMYMSEMSNCGTMIKGSGQQSIDVKTTTVDDFLGGKRKPDIVRMDIEGFEVEALLGMKKTLKSPLLLFIEVHNRRPEIKGMLLQLLEAGFTPDIIIPRLGHPRKISKEEFVQTVLSTYCTHIFMKNY